MYFHARVGKKNRTSVRRDSCESETRGCMPSGSDKQYPNETIPRSKTRYIRVP